MKRLMIACAAVFFLSVVLWYFPGPINGIYTISNITTDGAYFLYLKDGKAYWVFEHSSSPKLRGTYNYEQGVGWVLRRAKTGTKWLLEPRLFYLRYRNLDSNESGIEWRYPRVFKARNLIRARWANSE
jgi:hypothetical protein